jgi:acyl-CoA-dependent ceramide synthase
MRHQIFLALGLLQLLNLFWYYLVMRILVRLVMQTVSSIIPILTTTHRAIITSKTEDERSDDEDDGEEDPKEE